MIADDMSRPVRQGTQNTQFYVHQGCSANVTDEKSDANANSSAMMPQTRGRVVISRDGYII